jgi:4-hydroxy-tetrahydrodipicolinate reductase
MKICVCGAAGRMGRVIIGLIAAAEDLELAAAVDGHGVPAVGQDAGVTAGVGPLGVKILTGLEAEADAVIDFSVREAARGTAHLCRERCISMVLGTTGLTAEDEAEVEKTAAVVPCVVSPNMSVGVNLLFALAPQVAAALGDDYDIEIVEMHHSFKKDAPSGTALRLGERIAEARGKALEDLMVCGRQGQVGERPRGPIGIHAVRGGDVVGDHTVMFAGQGERVELVHRASSRESFARGAIRAARFAVGREPGRYTMRDVLGL